MGEISVVKPDRVRRRAGRAAALLVILVWQAGAAPRDCQAVQPTPAEMALRQAWVKEHFPAGTSGMRADAASARPLGPAVIVWNSYAEVFQNHVPGKGLGIAKRQFAHGIYCHAPTRMQVRLPGPGKSFSSTVGILTNPDSQGGSIVFTVAVGKKKAYTSPVMHRGEAGAAAEADLEGAREFFLDVGDAGDGIISDQGVWGEATVTLMDGKKVRLGDLPLQDALVAERSDATPPFSFLYDGQASDVLLPKWQFREDRDASDPGKTRRVRTYTDPKTGLVVRVTVVEYAGHPTVEWTLNFKNTGDKVTPVLTGIRSLDTSFVRPAGGEFALHSIQGDACTAESYRPFVETMPAGYSRRMAPAGGRPTNGAFPY